MKKLKCESCGANLVIDSNKEYGFCEYCQTNYKLDDNYLNNITINTPNLSNSKSMLKVPFVIAIVMFSIIFIVSTSIILTAFIDMGNEIEVKSDGINELIQSNEKKVEIEAFNGKFTIYNYGSKFFVEKLISTIIDSNNSETHQVDLVYNGTLYNDSNSMMNIKNSLEEGNYDITFEYDNDNYIEKVNITYYK